MNVLTIDTNVLMYAAGNDHPLRAPCRRIIECVASGELEAMTTPETIQEFAHVHARRRGRLAASAQAHEFALLLAPLRLTEPEHLELGLQLWTEYPELDAFDALLSAVALDTKDRTIVSADRAFAALPDVVHVFPDEAGLAGLLD